MPRYIDADEVRLIDAEKLKRKLIEGDGHDDDRFAEGYNFAINEIRGYIDNAPTADVQEVKHGRWILDKEGTELVCSVCGGFAPLNYFKYHRVRSEYCPDCGARIDCKKEE